MVLQILFSCSLLCHLMAQIYSRHDGLCLGKFSLNLFNIPTMANFSRRVSTILQLLLSKSHYLPLSLEGLNKTVFVPKKDYTSNRLVSGLLQLSSGTHLTLDETVLDNGQLNADGLKNLTTLGHLIKTQSVNYDFSYHPLAFETDIQCLILSEGRSMLPQDVQVMLKPETNPTQETIDAIFGGVGAKLDVELLGRLRKYLTLAKALPFDMADDAQNLVQEDFVRERQSDNPSIRNSEELHGLLILARLLATSHGEETLTQDLWNEAKLMEQRRKERSAHLPTRAQM
jgi:hypothetical protein